ncbi:MAG: L-histidine N(alpha)-methyltransferase [Planctomycetota bacterium]|nr:L-histidine N(alpha)-methyltransferase [Planctomycetota bacterium]
MPDESQPIDLLNQRPEADIFRDDVVRGLSCDHKRLPCKYFYDQRGSALFEAICELDEYYLTRTELAIMDRSVKEITSKFGTDVMLIEFGSGSSRKTRMLLDHLRDLAAYVPIDISRDHLMQTAADLATAYPRVELLPVCADFSKPFQLPSASRTPLRNIVYFPGSTIGNFRPDDAVALLSRIAAMCGAGGGLLIGIDLKKDTGVLEAAYNDSAGITAQFNLNLLLRINRELGADFDLDRFQHLATYNQSRGRIEMYLASRCDQTVTLGEHQFEIANGEAIRTEYSHKYDVGQFDRMANAAGFCLRQCWQDELARFGILYFEVQADPAETTRK